MCNESRPQRLRTLLAVAATVITGVALAAWVWLVLLRGGYWRTDQRLPPGGAEPPSLAVIVPARDEAGVLPATLPTLLGQDYPGDARVVLVDDNSTDGTAELARRLAGTDDIAGPEPVGPPGTAPDFPATGSSGTAAGVTGAGSSGAAAGVPGGGLPLTVLPAGEPAAGWTGKLWALRRGVEAAGDAEWLLFTDADIAHRPGSLAALGASTGGLDLVSQMARLRTRSPAERLVVPAFVYFFALLYPFRWVNRPRARTAAAAGGCTLVRAAALQRAGGVAAIRGAVIDDVSLARAVKRSGGRIFLGLSDTVDSVREYRTLGPLWRMVSRSAYAQLRRSPLLLAGTVAGLLLLFAVPVAATIAGAVTGDWQPCALGAAGWLLMSASYVPMLRYYGRPAPAALLLPFTALLYTAMTVDSAVAHYRGQGAAWKGRTYGRKE